MTVRISTGHLSALAGVFAIQTAAPTWAQPPLIVVHDSGGVSALPYYEDLHLQTSEVPQPSMGRSSSALSSPPTLSELRSDAWPLPVVSRLLSPGRVTARPIRAPGMAPLFLVGDDDLSRAWLMRMLPKLRALRASGMVVNVVSARGLAALRAQAAGLTLMPACGDDLARRLGLRHYPALVTATGIEP